MVICFLDTSNSAGTRAQGEETVEDADNTEHDISAEAESLDPTSETQQTVGGFGSREEFEEALTTIRNNILSGYKTEINFGSLPSSYF